MKTYARIEDNVVKELLTTEQDINALYHPSLVWTEVTGAVQVGWVRTTGGFAALPPPAPVLIPPSVTDLAAAVAEIKAKLALLHPAA